MAADGRALRVVAGPCAGRVDGVRVARKAVVRGLHGARAHGAGDAAQGLAERGESEEGDSHVKTPACQGMKVEHRRDC